MKTNKTLKKKLFAITMIIFIAFGSFVFASAKTEQPDYSLAMLGDVNRDNRMNTGDVAGILLYCSDADDFEIDLGRADINGDKKVDTGDATALLQYIVKDIEPISNFGKFVYYTGKPNAYYKWQGKEFRENFLDNPLYFSDLVDNPSPAIEPFMIQIDSFDEYKEFIKLEYCPYQMLMNKDTSKFDDLGNSIEAFNEKFFNEHSILFFLFSTEGFPKQMEFTNAFLVNGTLKLHMSVREDIMPGGVDIMLLLAMPKAEWESMPREYHVDWDDKSFN